jgi:DNA polymerase-3 subunit delta
MSVTLATGPNTYEMQQWLHEQRATFAEQHGTDSVERYEAADIDPNRLPDLLQGGSLFAAKRHVTLYSPSQSKAVADGLAQILDGVSDDIDLVLVEAKPDKRQRWYKTVKQSYTIKEFNQKSVGELKRWATAYAKQHDITIPDQPLQLLLRRVGDDQWRLASELDKLALRGTEITSDDIELMVEPTIQESIFDLLEQVVRGQTDGAVQLYQDLRKGELDPHQFVSMLAWQINIMLIVKLNERKSDRDIASAAKLAPFVVSKTKRLVKSLTRQQIIAIADATLEADIAMKKTRANAEQRAIFLIYKIGMIIS